MRQIRILGTVQSTMIRRTMRIMRTLRTIRVKRTTMTITMQDHQDQDNSENHEEEEDLAGAAGHLFVKRIERMTPFITAGGMVDPYSEGLNNIEDEMLVAA